MPTPKECRYNAEACFKLASEATEIAYRGKPNTSQDGMWVSIVPGYEVFDEKYPDSNSITVSFNGEVVH